MRFCWVTLNVRNMEESLAFYRDVLGLAVRRRMNPMPGTEIAFLGVGETEVELIHNAKNPEPSHGRDISIGFEVPSLDEVIEGLRAKGVTRISGPFQPGPTVRFIYIDDPNGAKVQLVESRRG